MDVIPRKFVFILPVLFSSIHLCRMALLCESNSRLCLEPRGQFPVPGECKKFANCWESCSTLSSCPGTLVFSPEKQHCEFTWELPAESPCFKPRVTNVAFPSMAESGNPQPASNPESGPNIFNLGMMPQLPNIQQQQPQPKEQGGLTNGMMHQILNQQQPLFPNRPIFQLQSQ